jgi:hypothetical protein
MENHFSRHWPVWFVVAAMGFSFHWVSKSWNTGTPIVSGDELSYEMPRPEGFEPGYDLSGRKIVRTFDRDQRIASVDGPGAVRQPMSPAKAATAPAVKKADEKKTAQNKIQKKKPTVTTRVIPADGRTLQTNTGNFADAKTTNSNNGYAGYTPKAATTNAQPLVDNQKNPEALTAAQWRETLLSSPTLENADKFVAAYQAGQVDAASFYKIADELLSDSSQNRQQAGLDILKKDISASSFAVLAKHDDESTQADLKAEIRAVLKSYGTSSKLSILSKVLFANDEKAVTVATEVLAEALSTQKAGGSGTAQTSDRGGIRSPGATPQIDASQWKLFLPGLQRLAGSQNASLAERAQSLLASIQALTTA